MFKSKEEREMEKQEKLEEQMKKYNLENLSQEDKEYIKNITNRLMGTGLISLGSKAEDTAKIELLKLLIEQNWLIVKLLNEINNKLDK